MKDEILTVEVPQSSIPIENHKSVCFLIGSGFSVPYGFETVGKINDMFTSLKADDIIISSDRQVVFANGEEDENGWMTINQRNFFVEFIAQYCSQLPDGEGFQYEEFYDYYYSRLRGEDNKFIDKFCGDFRNKHSISPGAQNDVANLLNDFNNIFTQLLASKLSRRNLFENGTHYVEYRPYDRFLRYLSYLVDQGYTVHLFTLNHDILLEHMCSHTGLWEHFCDGFNENGSPFYGDLNIKDEIHNKPSIPDINLAYKVRLKRFVNKYDKKVRLYKLHGSVDTHIINVAGFDRPRIKSLYSVNDFFVEMKNEHGALVYKKSIGNSFPDFLSGTTEKLRSYSDSYYEVLFDHLKNELPECDALAVIGYGFWDSGINEYLQKGIFDKSIPVSVIDLKEPEGPLFVDNKTIIHHLEKNLKDVTFEEYKEIIIR